MSDASMKNTDKQYRPPSIKTWGTVEELTTAGCTKPGGDCRQGSNPAQKCNAPDCKSYDME